MKLRDFVSAVGVLLFSISIVLGQQPGSKIWELQPTSDIELAPTIGPDGTVYVPISGRLWALNPDGSTKWTFPTGNLVFSSPAIGDDCTIYFGSSDGKLYALRPDGRKEWEFEVGGTIFSSPSIGSDGTVYFGRAGFLYAVSREGSLVWRFTANGQIWSSPAIGPDGTIYIGSENDAPTGNKLFAVNPDGTKRWDFVTVAEVASRNFVSSPAIGADGVIYVVSSDNKLYAIDPEGSKKWGFAEGIYDTFNIAQSSPAIGPDQTIYFCNFDTLFALSPDGTKKWSYVVGNSRSSPIVGADGIIYVGYGNNNLHAINPDGTRAWEFVTSGTVRSAPAISQNGIVYFGTVGYPPASRPEFFAIQGTPGSAPNPWPMFRGNLKHTARAPDGVKRPPLVAARVSPVELAFEPLQAGTWALASASKLQRSLWIGCDSAVLRISTV